MFLWALNSLHKKTLIIYDRAIGAVCILSVFTCCHIDSLTDQTGTGVMIGHHRHDVVLPTSQVKEVALCAGAVAFSRVAKATPGIDSVGSGPKCWIPCNHGDIDGTIYDGFDVGGNTWSWWETK